MSISVNEERAAANDRLTAIRLTMLTMRCMERWRRNVSDYDKAMILVSVVAITSERFTRAGLDEGQKALAQPIAPETLAPCNVSSIASATGLNRETTRRKVKALVEEGFLVRSEQGVIGFKPGHFQKDYIEALIRSQLDSLVRTTNDLIRDGTLDTDR
ncbi:MAG TPA: hypothetical protein VGB79_00590 [Allosphingosinicella sp.]